MDPQNQTVMNNPIANNPLASRPAGDKKVGPIVATLIIVLVLIIAALYLFAAKINQPAIPTDVTGGDTAEDAQTVQTVTNSSTDINDLQNDLDTSTAGLDSNNF